jgi:amino acid adenylation domain-containing protein
MERSFDWIIAALAIMRAGGAYVPLDPAWPDSRLAYAVSDSGSIAVVAREALLNRLRVRIPGIDPVRDAEAIAAAVEHPRRPVASHSLAYVIYTSGSTGTPKGVEITHANLNHLVRWHVEAFGVRPGDRVSHLAGLGFDAAAWEVWASLCAGATLCLPREEIRTSSDQIRQWMVRERITIGFVPTVLAAPMIAMEWPKETSLRFLLTGGDALQRGPSVPLPFVVVNNYGPTECTVVATSCVLQPGMAGPPPIGHPITGATVYLLDESRNQVADGEVGEIYVGGNGVGRGYRNLPEQTERSFLPDPFASAANARMYRTGDRGLRRADGEIEFRGRLDRQTKIRGYRIELDEIGSVLEDHPGVGFATVITRMSEAGENQLAAYVLPKESAPVPSASQLQQHLLKRVPDYMVPAVFIRLNALPLSPSGKVDLSMLPQVSAGQVLESVAAQAPASATEEKLLAIVRELLDNQSVSARDNFFLAGGHSLLGMQLVMRLASAFGVDLSLRQLFEAPTVERLASLVETMLTERRLAQIWESLLGRDRIGLDVNFFDLGGKPELMAALQPRIAAEFGQHIPIDKLLENPTLRRQVELLQSMVEAGTALPPGVLALQQNGKGSSFFWMHYLSVNLAKEVGEDRPFYAVRLTSEDYEALGDAPTFESIARIHMEKILATQPTGPYTVGGLCVGGILAFEIGYQLRAAGHEVALLVLLDPPNPSFLDSPNPFRPRLNNPRYLLKRAMDLGLRTTAAKVYERVSEIFSAPVESETPKTEVDVVQEMIEVAASGYKPRRYDGKVLLLLASDRPPHVNFLPGWQEVVPRDLHVQHLQGRHVELTTGPNVQKIADAITYHLTSDGEADKV